MEKQKQSKIIDSEFFALPPNKFICKIKAKTYQLERQDIEAREPSLFLCFNISEFGKYLISSSVKNKFVFLNNQTTLEIIRGTISKNKYDKLLKAVEVLKENDYSLVFINGEYPSIFGDNQPLSIKTTSFIFDTNLDIKFLTFPGEFFANPLWSDVQRKTKIYPAQHITVLHRKLVGFSEDEVNEYLNQVIPSSATVYTRKYPVFMKSDKRASLLERVMYCCPKCNSFFTLYSEFSCVKCSNCLGAIEFSPEGYILFSNKIKTFDDIDEFLYSSLTTKGFDVNAMVCYENIILKQDLEEPKKLWKTVKLEIFAENFVISEQDAKKPTTYNFADIEEVNLTFGNNVVVKVNKNKSFVLCGQTNENLYILKDLLKLNKN